MAKAVSKNARREGAQKLLCKCGGEIKMRSLFANGRLRHLARCENCKKEGRRPSDLMAKGA